jgi:putative transposase
VQRLFKHKPPRLELIFQRSNSPVYFVTFNTHARAKLLAQPEIHDGLVEYCRRATDFRIGVGRYVVMPDHIHLFVCFGIGSTTKLGVWIKGLKHNLDRVLLSMGYKPLQLAGQRFSSFWQPGFNDHLLRSDESYAKKWEYVLRNPERAGLVAQAEDWPYAGEIVRIDRT